MEEEEIEVYIELSKKIKFFGYYVSVGSILFSAIIATLQFLVALNSNNWVLTPSCWTVLLNFAYAVRFGKSFQDHSVDKQASILTTANTIKENRELIKRLEKRIEELTKEKRLTKAKNYFTKLGEKNVTKCKKRLG